MKIRMEEIPTTRFMTTGMTWCSAASAASAGQGRAFGAAPSYPRPLRLNIS
jgi:hypothetical protein